MNDDSKDDLLQLLKETVLQLKLEEEKNVFLKAQRVEPIAIIGMNCKFPGGANSIDKFWEKLLHSYDGITEIPLDRWDINKYYDADPNAIGKIYARGGGFIEDYDLFDAQFFNIGPKEAIELDPQQRLLLETSWEALENASVNMQQLSGSNTGVFVGVCSHDYAILKETNQNDKDISAYFGTGNSPSMASGRLAFYLGVQGPAITLDTACSSSLVATHLAVKSLRDHESNLAIVAGVNMILMPELTITCCRAQMLSPQSHCHTFSDKADGYVRSEGCGVVILQRLSDAIREGSNILAVIKGSAINQDGASSGLTVPNRRAQESLLQAALLDAGLNQQDISYIEAHGTGTKLGDPIEIGAISHVYNGRQQPLYLGAVKSNIGHLEAASGIAGLIKAVLCLQHKVLVPNINFEHLNPLIDLVPLHGKILQHTQVWDTTSVLRAGVSSFGISGTNAHVIIEEAPLIERSESMVLPENNILVLSAKTRESLDSLLLQYQVYLTQTQAKLADICYTAAIGRRHFDIRTVITGANKQQILDILVAQRYDIVKTQPQNIKVIHTTDLQELVTAYLAGADIDWNEYYKPYQAMLKKVILPTYQFQRERYWIDLDKQDKQDKYLPKNWSYQLQWEKAMLQLHNTATVAGKWLMLGKHPVYDELKLQGLDLAMSDIDIDIAASGMLKELSGIIVTPQFNDLKNLDDLQKMQSMITQVLSLVKALAAADVRLKLIFLTEYVYAILPTDRINIYLSPLVGLSKVITLEHPNLCCMLLDWDGHDIAILATNLLHEIIANRDENYEHQVAYRNSTRFVSRLNPVTLPHFYWQLDKMACYLITGGTGGSGLIAAKTLLDCGAKKIILASRNPDSITAKLAVNNLHNQYPNSIITAVTCDVANSEEVARVVDLSNLNHEIPLKGIIHAAGLDYHAPLIKHTQQDFAKIFAAKVLGAWNLHQATQTMKLDFFIFYSSIAAVLGSNGQAAYTAANAFLDGLTSYRGSLNLPAQTIQWGPWSEAGMVMALQQENATAEMISNQQGAALLNIMMGSTTAQLVFISPTYLRFMLDFVPQPSPKIYKTLRYMTEKLIDHHESTATWYQNFITTAREQQYDMVVAMVSDTIKQVLRIAANKILDPERGFFEMGFDSLLTVELSRQLKHHLGDNVILTPSTGFDYATINKLAAYIYNTLTLRIAVDVPITNTRQEESIAIIGMSCRFPQAANLDDFWQLLENGMDGMSVIPLSRWDNGKYYAADVEAPGKLYIERLGLLDDVAGFDAAFFEISPREARLMDPQQRIFLEVGYHALEHARLNFRQLKGSNTGIFVGVGVNEYAMLLQKEGIAIQDLDAYFATGNALNVIAGRMAYVFDFMGPAEAIDTACSSSLVALHHACQSLKMGDCDLALAGGVNILLSPENNIALCKARMLSPDSMCKTFDKDANGYARGEGCGVIVLKRLHDATRDGDNILAVIRGSAVNQDGASSGLTVPNGVAQAAVIHTALARAGIAPQDVDYIETHGTGTNLGDPIEVNTLGKVYGTLHSTANPLIIGTVKTNIGHLESAAGIAGVIKTVLALNHQMIPPHLHFQQLNPFIEAVNITIPLEKIFWQQHSHQRCAGVSSFGFSGTNAHVIIEEAPVIWRDIPAESEYPAENILLLSAKTTESLASLIQEYQFYLTHSKETLPDICYTAATIKHHFNIRAAITGSNKQQILDIFVAQQYTIVETQPQNIKNIKTIHTADLQELAAAYLAGADIDWHEYYKPYHLILKKVTLPNYQFQREHYWIDTQILQHLQFEELLHPLLGAKIPTAGKEQCFTNQLDLQRLEYLRDHKVMGYIVFPSAAYVETALAAACVLYHGECVELSNISFEDSLKLQPELVTLYQSISLAQEDNYLFTIHSRLHEHWQQHVSAALSQIAASLTEAINLDKLKAAYTMPLDLTHLYEHLQANGLIYGATFQTIKAAYANDYGNNLLVRLELNSDLESNKYHLHPALLDGAFQALTLFTSETVNQNNLYFPAHINTVILYAKAPLRLWATVSKNASESAAVISTDITLYDDHGMVVAKIIGLKAYETNKTSLVAHLDPDSLDCCYLIDWQSYVIPQTIVATPVKKVYLFSDDQEHVALISQHLTLQHQLQNTEHAITDIASSYLVYLYNEDTDETGLLALFEFTKNLIHNMPLSFILVTHGAVGVIQHDIIKPYHTAAMGYFKSFIQEAVGIRCYHLDVDDYVMINRALHHIIHDQPLETQLVCRGNKCYIPRLLRQPQYNKVHHILSRPALNQEFSYKADKTYLITGGTGGIGLKFAVHMLSQGAKHIALMNRHALDDGARAIITGHQVDGITINHFSKDVTDLEQTVAVICAIQESAFPLAGVFHMAGVLKDGIISNLSKEDFSKVLAPKILGSHNLHLATQDIPLDCFVLFSSIASLLGSAGQSNYAAANAFMDGLAVQRRSQHLPALSINWGPWSDVGMAVSMSDRHRATGFAALTPQLSFVLLERLLALPYATVGAASINWDSIAQYTTIAPWLSNLLTMEVTAHGGLYHLLHNTPQESRAELLKMHVKNLIAAVFGIADAATLDEQGDFLTMGMDSLMAIEIKNKLQLQLSDKIKLHNSLLLEYKNMEKLCDYLISQPALATSDQLQPVTAAIELRHMPLSDSTHKYALSLGQARLFFIQQLFPAIPNYNISIGIKLTGNISNSYLKQAIAAVIERHEPLRTQFIAINAAVLSNNGVVDFNAIDLTHAAEISDTELKELCKEYTSIIFDLSILPLCRFYLFKINSNLHLFLGVFHHIVTDGTSGHIFLHEITENYEKLLAGKPLVTEALSIEYHDYVRWQQEYLVTPYFTDHTNYWVKKLSGVVPLELSTDYVRQTSTINIKDIALDLPTQLFANLHKVALLHKVTLFSVLLASYAVLLYRYSNQDDFVIGVPVEGRYHAKLASLIGFFVETIPLRVQIQAQQTFGDLVRDISSNFNEAIQYQHLSLPEIINQLNLSRDLSREPLFQTTFMYQAYDLENNPNFKNLQSEYFYLNEGLLNYDINISITSISGKQHVSCKYNADLFKPATIQQMMHHWENIVAEISKNTEIYLSHLNFLDKHELHNILYAFNATDMDFSTDKTINQLFEEQVAKTPNHIAIIFEKIQLTYQDLNAKANQLAYYLRDIYQVKGDDLIALCLDRSEHMLIAILATLKSGAAYVPLDSSYPDERIAYMLMDTGTKVVLADENYHAKLRNIINQGQLVIKVEIIDNSSFQYILANYAKTNLISNTNSSNLAYVIYTSGTTGKPKGVALEHRGIINRIQWMNTIYPLVTMDKILQKTPYVFDVSVWELFWAHWYGASIVFSKPEGHKDPNYLIQLIQDENISIIHFVPSMLEIFNQTLSLPIVDNTALIHLRYIFCSGEILQLDQVKQLHNLLPHVQLHNLYGPTEASVDVLYYDCSSPKLDQVYIGKPIANTTTYILDPYLNPLPVGVIGELYIGGVGLAREYLNLSDLTAERFIANPFQTASEQETGKNARLYKTGDLARYLPDGNIKYQGRNDFQVKMRGFRIELGEIETQLLHYPKVKQVVVLAKDHTDNGNKYLVAYYVSASQLDESAILAHLCSQLPNYMVPSILIWLSQLPLTINGKLDRHALSDLDYQHEKHYEPATTTVQEQLVLIWSEVLKIKRIGIKDDFFELGGNSLLVIQLIQKIEQVFNKKLPVATIFTHTTIQAMEQLLIAPSVIIHTTENNFLDLEAEAKWDTSVIPKPKITTVAMTPENILLTGSSGFLGIFLLEELLKQTEATIYCLVRAESKAAVLKRLRHSLNYYNISLQPAMFKRIIPVLSDLEKPCLGLSTRQLQNLAKKIDTIYHNAAMVNFIYPYDKLKTVNVLALQEIIKFSTWYRLKPIHYISTISVFESTGYFKQERIYETTCLPQGNTVLGGYAQSKWVAEKILSDLKDVTQITIYRPGMIVGDSRTNIWHEGDIATRFIKGILQLGVVPDIDILVNFVSVDYVSDAITRLSLNVDARGGIYHIINPTQVPLTKIVTAINEVGYELREVSYLEWQHYLTEHVVNAPEHLLYPLLPSFFNVVRNGLTAFEMLPTRPLFDCSEMLARLTATPLPCANVILLIKKLLRYLRAAPPKGIVKN